VANGRKGKRSGDRVAVDGDWLPLPLSFLAGRACLELSPVALKMLMLALAQLGAGGRNNGRIDLHRDRLRAAGWASAGSAHAAIHELIAAGLLVVTRQGKKGSVGLYGVSLLPMYCNPEGLEVGPGGWSTRDWREPDGASERPTAEAPARWNKARGGEGVEKRIRCSRGGNALPQSVPAAGMHSPEKAPCVPATGQHQADSARNAFPPRDSLSRKPSPRTPGGEGTTVQRLTLADVPPWEDLPAHLVAEAAALSLNGGADG
jgi:hypothetical protein